MAGLPNISSGASAAASASGGYFTGGGVLGDFSPSIGGAKTQSLTTVAIVAVLGALAVVFMLWRPKKRK